MTLKQNHRRFNPVAKELKDDRFKLKVIKPKDHYKRIRPHEIIKELENEERIENHHHVLR